MALKCRRQLFCFGMPSISIHNKAHMLWDGSCSQDLANSFFVALQSCHFIRINNKQVDSFEFSDYIRQAEIDNSYIIISMAIKLLKVAILVLALFTFEISTSYDKKWSIQVNRYSMATHCSESHLIHWNCKICKEGEKVIDLSYIDMKITNMVGYIGYLPSKNLIIVAVRGTKDIKNWVSDFTYQFINYPSCKDCKVHEGFYYDYFSIEGKIRQEVRRLIDKYPDSQILVTGSSLGAAVSTIAALQLQLLTGKVSQVHNFGSPRLGNQNYSKFLNEKIPEFWRVIHHHDLIPHLPFQEQNYHHAAYEVLYDEKMQNYKICNASGEDPSCSNSYYPSYSIPDHLSYWFNGDVC